MITVKHISSPTRYTYDGAFVIFSEDDGARIVSDTKCEFLERVPDVVEDIFKIGSTHPASMLYDAYDSFEVAWAGRKMLLV